MSTKPLYKVTFLSAGKIYELYARSVASSALWGFTEISDLVWDTNESLVIDPTEEKLRDEFGNTRVLHLPMQSVVRVEEVERKTQLVIRDCNSGDKIVTPFPMPGKRG
ncbi:DUF1820 family protein [Pseudomarimonas arenosa]|uniref:DUF1820 family protein n=1 Tax=Pseudomarimonas arenosa TaxID=2774145 RepID=A0AAW3ZE97_9GAMM|nr:DUF1820 family protein [Pseudomarimonas arenosa]MBD8524303.1 DUF1820 family protein [Pseudomarimonas arenosa]